MLNKIDIENILYSLENAKKDIHFKIIVEELKLDHDKKKVKALKEQKTDIELTKLKIEKYYK